MLISSDSRSQRGSTRGPHGRRDARGAAPGERLSARWQMAARRTGRDNWPRTAHGRGTHSAVRPPRYACLIEVPRRSARRTNCIRRRRTYSAGPMPSCSPQHLFRVRAETPSAAQISATRRNCCISSSPSKPSENLPVPVRGQISRPPTAWTGNRPGHTCSTRPINDGRQNR
jgi:hypothetical protein